VAGSTGLLVYWEREGGENIVEPPQVGAATAGSFNKADFLSTGALGTETPRRCPACRGCKECKFLTTTLSAQENAEFDVICKNLTFNPDSRCWTTSYPFTEDPAVLSDNQHQARALMQGQERQLAKKGRLQEFNDAFSEIVNRGVFRELSAQELQDWSGPVNYVGMVVAYKSGPHASTPLRICVNSSLRQPPPVSKSLNDILLKGPAALADLFSVTLGFREHRFALTKDLTKFYNCVLADEVAQHTRRVMWRFGETESPPKIFVTTTVNFGDRPAGCIAIAAIRMTADKFGGDSEAAWFLKNRTYMDDCMAGHDSKEKLLELSSQLDEIVEQGGFRFKETHCSGDKN